MGQHLATGRSHAPNVGVSLLEVLIAILVISIGVLGAARLQLTSKHANLESSQRAAATLLAQEIFERMRGNRAALGVYTADGAELAAAPAEPATDCASAQCTAEDLARFDLWEWWQSVRGATEQAPRAEEGGEAVMTPVGGLASPTVCITGPAGGPGNSTG